MSTHLSNDPNATPTSAPNAENSTHRHGRSDDDNCNSNSNSNANIAAYPVAAAEYEEVAQSPELFWKTLEAFHRSFGTKFSVPTIGGKALDLHCLFVEVTSRGGLEKVIRDRRWKEVIVVFNFPPTITSASFVLRKYYLSLLYHFEQVYYFHKRAPSIANADIMGRSPSYRSATPHGLEEGAATNQLSETPTLQPGCSVTGFIDGKFDNGYLVSVNLGSDELKGVLYHIPHALHKSGSFNTSVVPPHRKRKSSKLALRDPSRPKPNRSGYTFFFAEQYARLKPLFHGQEKAISKKIGLLWSKLTEAEKQVYQEKGLRDKERYRAEMLEYKSTIDSRPQ
ncbi:high mobility group B protein 10 [Malania oleifera]|uniref:high mobility group B protein 10 n=1 Tax=Malania oleifera TaxID=397392 RepID=UPI0025AEC0AC|nr:high mobility group B protein 10 [Malania oleifera]